MKKITVTASSSSFEQLELVAPFGFKGGASSFLFNTAAFLQSENAYGVGLGTEGILWSDAKVFFGAGNLAGSAMMYIMTDRAVRLLQGQTFSHPDEALDFLLPQIYEYGKAVTANPALRMTFALNSLVPVDFAVWQLYFKENGLSSFDDIIPASAAPTLSCRHGTLACIPLISYGVSDGETLRLAESGTPLLKIKIGKEYDWDIERVKRIHALVKDIANPYTESGHILYYLDANGRYESLDCIQRLLDALDRVGALGRVALLEEPFAEGSGIDVSSIPLTFAADESAHSDKDVEEMASLGYKAVALKPIAKTLTMTFRMLEAARRHGMKAFCADLTVNPIMVDWNKNVAARLSPIDGMKIGAIESNGPQNYVKWEEMLARHPLGDAEWIREKNGVFRTGEGFFAESGGIFRDSAYYASLFGVG